MKYCIECVMPDTKPGLTFDDKGVCAACNNHKLKKEIDWDIRGTDFLSLVSCVKDKLSIYDCVIPVSGGKDSFVQVKMAIAYGLNPLAVSIDIGLKTQVGKDNLDKLSEYCDLFIFKPEQESHKELIKIGLERYGDPDYYSHGMIYSWPVKVAYKFEIPLVLYGEDPGFEYVGDNSKGFDFDWFYKHAVRNYDKGMSEIYKFSKLRNYFLPGQFEVWNVDVKFLGHYFFWDSVENFKMAKQMGFRYPLIRKEGSYRKWVGVDEDINRIHQYIKVLKFGYGRATDHACEDIRNGKITREEGIELVRKYDTEDLTGKYIFKLADYLGEDRLIIEQMIEKQRDKDIWYHDGNKWHIKEWIGYGYE